MKENKNSTILEHQEFITSVDIGFDDPKNNDIFILDFCLYPIDDTLKNNDDELLYLFVHVYIFFLIDIDMNFRDLMPNKDTTNTAVYVKRIMNWSVVTMFDFFHFMHNTFAIDLVNAGLGIKLNTIALIFSPYDIDWIADIKKYKQAIQDMNRLCTRFINILRELSYTCAISKLEAQLAEKLNIAQTLQTIIKQTEGVPSLVEEHNNEGARTIRLTQLMLSTLNLTEKQQAVLRGNYAGKTQQQIAKELDLSIGRIKQITRDTNAILKQNRYPNLIWNNPKKSN